MRFIPTLALAASASTAFAAFCGTNDLHPRALRELPMHKREVAAAAANRTSVSINTYIHVISNDETVEEGNIPDEVIEREMKSLNAAYKAHGFSFNLVEVTRTINVDWTFPGGGPGRPNNETQMRTALRKGSYADLNLFFVPSLVPLGRCNLPVFQPGNVEILNDGCVLKPVNDEEDMSNPMYASIPAHEIGHWLGLSHTWQNGCSAPGDFVDDTPYETPTEDDWSLTCPPPDLDSCPDQPGLDPKDNIMTYTKFYPQCQPMKFTPGQAERMHIIWNLLRSPFL